MCMICFTEALSAAPAIQVVSAFNVLSVPRFFNRKYKYTCQINKRLSLSYTIGRKYPTNIHQFIKEQMLSLYVLSPFCAVSFNL